MRFRLTGRFYLALLILVLLFVYIFRDDLFGSSQVTVIMEGTAEDSRVVQAVIIRDESLITETQITRVEYLADEASFVQAGDSVACIYSLEYSTKLINELNSTRKEIQTYQKALLGNELDSGLEVLNLDVNSRALELKALVNGTSRGNLLSAVSALESAMVDRRAYMSANKRSDVKLMKLYDVEAQRLSAITSWQQTKTAPRDGIVSFYMDGYESCLNSETVYDLEITDAQAILSGSYEKPSLSKGESAVCRVFDQYHWYLLLLSNDTLWNPVQDTEYSFIVSGFDDILYSGTIVKVTKNGTTTMALLEVTDPIDALLYTRTGSVTIGAHMSGLLVSKKAIATVNGQDGVWLYDVPGGTFVPVEVITTRSDGTVLFTPLVDGVLTYGSQVLIK